MLNYNFIATTRYMINHPYPKDLQEAKDWAYNLVYGDENYLILDTETTGLGDAEIVDICVMGRWGQPVLDTLVKPTIPIPEDSTYIHQITDEMVKDAPTFPEIYPRLKQLIEGRQVVIYNKGFDCRIIRYCCELHNLEPIKFYSQCAMLWYAQYYGNWSDYYGNYKWQKLPGGGKHRALSDCKATYNLLREMAKREYSRVETPYRQFPPVQVACKWKEVGVIDFWWRNKSGLRRVTELKVKLPCFYLMRQEMEDEDDDVPF